MTRAKSTAKKPSNDVVNLEKKRKSKKPGDGSGSGFFSEKDRRETLSALLIAVATILFACLLLNPRELSGQWITAETSSAGMYGKLIAKQIGLIFGFGGLVLPVALALWGVSIFKQLPLRLLVTKGLSLCLSLISSCTLLSLIYPAGFLGGALGARLGESLYTGFGVISYLMVAFAFMISVVIGTPISFSGLVTAGAAGGSVAWGLLGSMSSGVASRMVKVPEENNEKEDSSLFSALLRKTIKSVEKVSKSSKVEVEEEAAPLQPQEAEFQNAKTRVIETPALRLLKQTKAPVPEKSDEAQPEPTASELKGLADAKLDSPETDTAPEQVDTKKYTPLEDFTLPSVELLNEPESRIIVTEGELKSKAQRLQQSLQSFGIQCKVGDIVPGPVVTRFEILPAPGQTVSSITNRADDIALNMAAPSIRIEAPIPGKRAIGIEIPHANPQIVTLKEVIMSDQFRQMREISPLAVAFGLDIAGCPVVADLRKMPHVLIAGATGAGKSVCINTIICSIILSSDPTEVKMLMIDPKMVELHEYNGIPHLIAPVITSVKKAPKALHWAVEEMERRHRQLVDVGVRTIEGYNAVVKEQASTADVNEVDGEIDDFVDLEEDLPDFVQPPGLEKMPYIVVIVDEFCDLMMAAKKDCEDAITELAAMARAVGIHLIIATQRPSVDVITGVIKANLPSRISFQVTSKVDSRTVLDTGGAESLLGKGDMLYNAGDSPKPMRLQGSYIDGKEISRVIEHYSNQGQAKRVLELGKDKFASPLDNLVNDDDELLTPALWIVWQDGHASVSRLQRRLKIGHPRAARLVDIMESKGLVSAPDGSKPRKLLFDEEYLRTLQSEDDD
ncbi:MAG: DNA translocase FtsK 4TM domain-containing protein [Candidatus Lindowbacteria bacterium]|nr:DNA translocase FtsK 4TM domain-containing protein [Candidatus Lindowbacteria bacterium]